MVYFQIQSFTGQVRTVSAEFIELVKRRDGHYDAKLFPYSADAIGYITIPAQRVLINPPA